jgi:hypothetical protein
MALQKFVLFSLPSKISQTGMKNNFRGVENFRGNVKITKVFNAILAIEN